MLDFELRKTTGSDALMLTMCIAKGQTIRKLIEGGGQSRKKNIRVSVSVNEKNSCSPINPKKYSCYGLKKFIQGI